MPTNPFKKTKLKNKAAVRGSFGVKQVKDIYDLDLAEFRTQRLDRDLFLFSMKAIGSQ